MSYRYLRHVEWEYKPCAALKSWALLAVVWRHLPAGPWTGVGEWGACSLIFKGIMASPAKYKSFLMLDVGNKFTSQCNGEAAWGIKEQGHVDTFAMWQKINQKLSVLKHDGVWSWTWTCWSRLWAWKQRVYLFTVLQVKCHRYRGYNEPMKVIISVYDNILGIENDCHHWFLISMSKKGLFPKSKCY